MIEHAIMLSLDKRKDRWPAIAKQVNTLLNLPLHKFVCGAGEDDSLNYDHVDVPGIGGHANAFLCHKKMCRQVLSTSAKNALFLEDDCYVVEDRWKRIYNSEIVQNFISGANWDGIYFGWQQRFVESDTDEIETYEEEWSTSGSFAILRAHDQAYSKISGFHGILLSRRLLKVLATASYGPMDAYVNQRLRQFRMYYVAPKIIGASPSWSFCNNNFQNRTLLV